MLRTGALVDGRYRLEEMLGRGGMADVFRAVDDDTNRAVALKALRVGEPNHVARFQSEIAVLERLEHPSVVSLRDSGTHDHLPYLVMDLVDGPALDEVLENGPLGTERSIAVGRQVAVALAEAHRLGIVHRDVKPANVLLDGRGRTRLSDFGIARMAGSPQLTTIGSFVGSPMYVAPEQVGGLGVGPAADIYALGLLVLECLTGAPCFTGTPNETALARLRRDPAIPADLPGWLRRLLRAMTARDPHRRPDAETAAATFAHRSDRQRTSTALGRLEVAAAAIAATVLLTGLAVGSALGMRDLTVTEAPPPTSETTVAPPPTTAPPAEAPVAAAAPGHGEGKAKAKAKGKGRHGGPGKG